MIALLILAMSLTAISYANSIAVSQVARITRMTTASFLMESIVNDVHATYVAKGFPTNNVEDRQCELPKDFQNEFDCRFDLKAMNLTPDQVQGIIQAGIEQFMGGGAQGEGGTDVTKTPGSPPGTSLGGADLSQLAILAPLFGPEGQQILQMCNVNLGAILMGIGALSQYMPQIIDQVSRRTRQLTVRLTWKDGPAKHRELTVQTFIVSLPEEEIQAMKEAERAREAQDAINELLKRRGP
jgi:hypothetical protein